MFRLIVLVAIIALIGLGWFVMTAAYKARKRRAKWTINERSVRGGIQVELTRMGEQPLIIGHESITPLEELRAEAVEKAIAYNDRPRLR